MSGPEHSLIGTKPALCPCGAPAVERYDYTTTLPAHDYNPYLCERHRRPGAVPLPDDGAAAAWRAREAGRP